MLDKHQSERIASAAHVHALRMAILIPTICIHRNHDLSFCVMVDLHELFCSIRHIRNQQPDLGSETRGIHGNLIPLVGERPANRVDTLTGVARHS